MTCSQAVRRLAGGGLAAAGWRRRWCYEAAEAAVLWGGGGALRGWPTGRRMACRRPQRRRRGRAAGQEEEERRGCGPGHWGPYRGAPAHELSWGAFVGHLSLSPALDKPWKTQKKTDLITASSSPSLLPTILGLLRAVPHTRNVSTTALLVKGRWTGHRVKRFDVRLARKERGNRRR